MSANPSGSLTKQSAKAVADLDARQNAGMNKTMPNQGFEDFISIKLRCCPRIGSRGLVGTNIDGNRWAPVSQVRPG